MSNDEQLGVRVEQSEDKRSYACSITIDLDPVPFPHFQRDLAERTAIRARVRWDRGYTATRFAHALMRQGRSEEKARDEVFRRYRIFISESGKVFAPHQGPWLPW